MLRSKGMMRQGSTEVGSPIAVLLCLLCTTALLPAAERRSAALLRTSALGAQVLLTQDEALELAFPAPATVERRSAFLEEAQIEEARGLAGGEVSVDQSVVTHYVAHRDGEPLGVAYFDVHRVRTMREVVMVVVTPEGAIERVEILRFAEPPEYMASEEWIEQLEGQTLSPELEVGRDIINMTGATLTSGALTRASRRVLALHEVIRPFAESDTDGDGGGRQ